MSCDNAVNPNTRRRMKFEQKTPPWLHSRAIQARKGDDKIKKSVWIQERKNLRRPNSDLNLTIIINGPRYTRNFKTWCCTITRMPKPEGARATRQCGQLYGLKSEPRRHWLYWSHQATRSTWLDDTHCWSRREEWLTWRKNGASFRYLRQPGRPHLLDRY